MFSLRCACYSAKLQKAKVWQASLSSMQLPAQARRCMPQSRQNCKDCRVLLG